MDDLLTRLRYSTGRSAFGNKPVYDKAKVEAADRIEALETQLREAEERAERYRVALEKIANHKPSFDYCGSDEFGVNLDIPGSPYDRGKEDHAKLVAEKARAALSDGGENG